MEIQRQHTKDQIALPPSSSSSSSSPAHEFSFNISIQSQQPPSAIDLTPADDIFFHGHLLPLHLLPISPRSSIDGSAPPITGCICSSCDRSARCHSFNSYEYATRRIDEPPSSKPRTKAKSFSLFGLARRRKEAEDDVNKKKAGFDMSHFLKKYVRMFSRGRTEDIHFRKQPYSFSGAHLSPRQDFRGEFSAPASMRTSPTNSGVLPATSTPPSNDSTMEELQAAIQAAITHCKDSNGGAAQKKFTT